LSYGNVNYFTLASEVEAAARAIGRQIRGLHAGNEGEIDAAFATILQIHAEAVPTHGQPPQSNRLPESLC
jgi:hypothetical protein